MDENLNKQQTVQQQSSIASGDYTNYNADRVNEINRMYDANINAQKSNLESAYNQNVNTLESNRQKIADQYNQNRNMAATSYERSVRNFNEAAAGSGLNSGAGSQAQLAMNAAYQKNLANMGTAEAQANADLDTNLANLKIQYQSDMNTAIANNDYQRAAALLNEYNDAYNRELSRSQMLAGLGDYSGYVGMGQMTEQQAQAATDLFNRPEQQRAAELLAQQGDYSGYVGLGYMNDAQAQQAAWNYGKQDRLAAAALQAEQGDYTGYVTAGYMTPEQAAQAAKNYGRSDLEKSAAMLAANGDFSGYVSLGYMTDAQAAQAAQNYRNDELANNAPLLAQYGDFSGYEQLYGKDTAAQMEAVWAAQNPLIAYSLGKMTADQYRTLTGTYPEGYSTKKSSSGYRGSSPSSSPSNSTTSPAPSGDTTTQAADAEAGSYSEFLSGNTNDTSAAANAGNTSNQTLTPIYGPDGTPLFVPSSEAYAYDGQIRLAPGSVAAEPSSELERLAGNGSKRDRTTKPDIYDENGNLTYQAPRAQIGQQQSIPFNQVETKPLLGSNGSATPVIQNYIQNLLSRNVNTIYDENGNPLYSR